MPSKMLLLYGVPMFVGCCAILWHYWDRFRKPSKPRGHHKKKILISADCWLSVFDLLEPSQLGLGIALVSHRFDFYVDEHFKTRKWTFGMIRIWSKIGENGTIEMEIANNYWKPMPIPQIQMPRKVVGFERIQISYIDQNAIIFFHRLRPLFASFCPINLSIVCINASNDHHTLELILRNIGPMIARNICAIQLSVRIFRHLRQFVPTILNDCPSLCAVITDFGDLFPAFPADDNAMASDGQALAKWLFTPLQNDVPKVFNCYLYMDDGNFASNIEPFKAAFANASFPVNSIIVILLDSFFVDSVVPFEQTNALTGEQLALKRINDSNCFVLVRCPIVRDMDKWAKWEKEAIGWEIDDQWNRIDIQIYGDDDAIGEGLLDEIPGPGAH